MHWQLNTAVRLHSSSSLGSIINLERLDLNSTKAPIFLGLHWDWALHSVALIEGKYSKLQSSAKRSLRPTTVSCWDVQKFLGLFCSFAAFVVNKVQCHSRSLQHDFSVVYRSYLRCSRICPISDAASKGVLWWVNLSIRAKPISLPLLSQSITMKILY